MSSFCIANSMCHLPWPAPSPHLDDRRSRIHRAESTVVESRNAQPVTPATRVGVGLAKSAACLLHDVKFLYSCNSTCTLERVH